MVKRASKEELQAKRLSKQVIKYEPLLKLIEPFGFQYRRAKSGSSHIRVWHPDYPKIRHFGVIAGTSKTGSQRYAIDGCLQIIEWEEQARRAGLDYIPQAAEEFQTAAKDALSIPDNYELVQGRNNPGKFLRHRRLPQIATELTGDIRQESIDESIVYLDDRVQKLDHALKSAVGDHDFEMDTYPNGTILLTHSCHDVDVVLYPFTPRRENWTVISQVEKAIEDVQMSQLFQDEALKQFLESREITEEPYKRKDFRSFRTPSIFFDDESYITKLHTTPNGYFSGIGLLRFIDATERCFINSLEKGMKARYGFNLKPVGKDKILGTNPLVEKPFDFFTPDVMPDIERMMSTLDFSDPEDKKQFSKHINLVLERFDIVRNGINQIIKNFESDINILSNRLTKTGIGKSKIVPEEKTKIGEIGNFKTTIGQATFTFPMLKVQSAQRGIILIPPLNVVVEFEKRLSNSQTIKTRFNPNGQLPLPPFKPGIPRLTNF